MTKHTVAETGTPQPNRLQHETSPYLQQHALNPVDWYPWGEEALARARNEDRPIFLSIGYSACHWCHVMEHESFENPAIAALMNQHFVNIKVDREERPDLDQIYMNSIQLLTGRGGWPMSVFLTPELKPFYGGTYWPPESRMGMPGFADVLQGVHDAWNTRREAVLKSAEEVTAGVIQMSTPLTERSTLTDSILNSAMQDLLRQADRNHGGFGGAPKFPHPMDLRVLLRTWKRFGYDDAMDVARLTLDKMADGGIYDHLGGGFHRYSTDGRWLVPHFEKMLYDNALLTSAYLEAFQATGKAGYASVVRETLDYVLREMTQPEGGFYSTQDADSEGVEGKFFVWSDAEIAKHLDEEAAHVLSYYYDVTPQGNWEGVNILNRVRTHAQAAKVLEMDEQKLQQVLDRAKQTLLDVRSKRIPPGRDDKVLVSWNGMMISAMAQAAQVLGEAKYADAAARAADFILNSMRDDAGRLKHSYKDGAARLDAYLDDYACLIDGLVDVYQVTFDASYLERAIALAELMIEDFSDEQNGGFFYTAANHEKLITRNKDWQDGATPSGNSVAATALLRLGRLTSRVDLENKGMSTLEMLSGLLGRHPIAAGQALIALDFALGATYEVALIDGNQPDESDAILRELHSHFLPNKVIARRSADTSEEQVAIPLLRGKHAQDGTATVYMCEHGTCRAPVLGAKGMKTILAET